MSDTSFVSFSWFLTCHCPIQRIFSQIWHTCFEYPSVTSGHFCGNRNSTMMEKNLKLQNLKRPKLDSSWRTVIFQNFLGKLSEEPTVQFGYTFCMLIICIGSHRFLPCRSCQLFHTQGARTTPQDLEKRRELLINKTEGNIKFIDTETAHMTLQLLAESEQFFLVSQLEPSGENFKW